jgi:hypothetical protein
LNYFRRVLKCYVWHGYEEAAMSGRLKRELVLSESEFEQLKALMARRKTAQALALRARIVLAPCRRDGQQDGRGETAAYAANRL